MKYGTGGDCTYAHGCLPRKGYFHIDTSNTGLIVDKTVGRYIHVTLMAYDSGASDGVMDSVFALRLRYPAGTYA